jgi:hypothetical protein
LVAGARVKALVTAPCEQVRDDDVVVARDLDVGDTDLRAVEYPDSYSTG